MFLTPLSCVYCYKIFSRWYYTVIKVSNASQKFALGRLVAQHWIRRPSLHGRSDSRRRGHSFSMPAFATEQVGPLLRRHSVRVSRGTSSILTEVWVGFLSLSRKLFRIPPQIMPRPPSSTNKQTNKLNGTILEKLSSPASEENPLQFMEAEGLFPQSQNPATSPYSEPVQSSPYPPTDFFQIRFNIILPFTRMSSMWSLFLRFSHQTPVCTSSFSLPYMPHAPLISFSLIFTWVTSCENERSWAPHCAVFSISLLYRFS